MNLRLYLGKVMLIGVFGSGMMLSGCLTNDDDDDNGNGDALQEKTTTLGAQENALGSSLDLDDWQVFTYSTVPGNEGDVDLFYGYSTALDVSAIYSPHVAKAGVAGSLPFGAGQGGPADWDTANVTELRTASLNETQFEGITTKAQVDSLWGTASQADDGRIPITIGTTFLAESDEDRRYLVRITDFTTGTAGVASLTAKAKW